MKKPTPELSSSIFEGPIQDSGDARAGRQIVTDRPEDLSPVDRIYQDRLAVLNKAYENELLSLRRNLSAVSDRLAAIENSTSWKMTHVLRRLLGRAPGLATLCRRTAKLAWWTLTVQLGRKLRERRAMQVGRVPMQQGFLAPEDRCLAIPLGYSLGTQGTEPSTAVVCHMFYAEMAPDFRRYFLNIPHGFDLFLTTDTADKQREIARHFSGWDRGQLDIRLVPNRGRDIAPALIACRDVYDEYEFFLHVHTKRSNHEASLAGWRIYLLETLLGSREMVGSIFECFNCAPRLGMVAAQHYAPVRGSVGWGPNLEVARGLAGRMNLNLRESVRLDFPSGSMFWARSAALAPLLGCRLSLEEFPPEEGQRDGTLSHAIEHLLFHVCEQAGFTWVKVAANALALDLGAERHIASRSELVRFLESMDRKLLDEPLGERTQWASPPVVQPGAVRASRQG